MLRARVTPALAEALERIAREDGATTSEVVRRLVAEEVRRRAGTSRAWRAQR